MKARNKTKIFSRQANRWNVVFVFVMAIMLAFSFWYSQMLVEKLREDERLKIKNWAAAMQHQMKIIQYAKTFFTKLEAEERNYATIWSYAYERLLSPSTSPQELDFFIRLISENKTIPFLVVDRRGNIIEVHDPKINKSTRNANNILNNNYTTYDPISVYTEEEEEFFFYYRTSELFLNLKELLKELSDSFDLGSLSGIVSVPIIVTDQTQNHILQYSNLPSKQFYSDKKIRLTLEQMKKDNIPIEVESPDNNSEKIYIFYESSLLLKRLRFLPMALFLVLLMLIIAIILVLNLARKTEQNQVWWGMSKETAHQLGTPLSSLLAWIEYYRLQPNQQLKPEDLTEMEKDVHRLQLIAQRFSKIGSIPELSSEDISIIVHRAVSYIKSRTSKRIIYTVTPSESTPIICRINTALFEWVIENLCNNAVNAIGGGEGEIKVSIEEHSPLIYIDIQDTGKGIPKNMFDTIFEPGFTTKSRGWGLGLTLCKRIIGDYHKGKIFVKSSTINEGSTFRIVLNQSVTSNDE